MRIVDGHVFAYLAYTFVERQAIPRNAEIAVMRGYDLRVWAFPHIVDIAQSGSTFGIEFRSIEVDIALWHCCGQLVDPVIEPG